MGFDLIKVVKICCNKVVFFTTRLAPTVHFRIRRERFYQYLMNADRLLNQSKAYIQAFLREIYGRIQTGGGVAQTIKEYF